MKTIGLIGGMSWESTMTYYRVVNQVIKERLGGLHSAKCLLYSVDFEEIEACQAKGEWERSGEILTDAARALERAGADFILICTNTMHKVATQVQAGIAIPLVHIADATADRLLEDGVSTVALLGTRYTMQQEFYKERLTVRGIGVLVPEVDEMEKINAVIYGELCLGKINPASKAAYLEIIDRLATRGAQGVILGCTEIGLLVQQADTAVSLYDTAYIHAEKAALLAVEQ